jgi:hypothetical protein
MITSPLPDEMLVQPARLSPTLAAGRPFMNTLPLPALIEAECVPHLLPPGF